MGDRKNLVKSEYGETWIQNGVIYQSISPDVYKIDLKIAKQLVSDRIEASGGFIKLPVVCFLNNAINIKPDAKRYYRTRESYENITALALVMDNYIARLVATLVFNISKPIIPTNLFNSEEKALIWLKQFDSLN